MFTEAFKTHFVDPDFKGMTLRELSALHQIGSCIQYAARFRKIVVSSYLGVFPVQTFLQRVEGRRECVLAAVGKRDSGGDGQGGYRN